ncbi:type II secretion system protein [Prosthecobacter fluviatilis]|uniref:Type II secretion system protein n=1 Tax=Prosthecobacter fluviatilis TaxID=445931 RepID=A0ABW0KRQ3_9BACT
MKAFTLLEMIVVLAIASLVIGIGAGAVQKLTEEHELLRAAHDAERILMQAMTRTLTTVQPQVIDLTTLSQGAKLTVRRAGKKTFDTATNQHLRLRPGGLCEPLTLRWQNGANWVSATLDPLTAGFQELEESL